MAISDYLVSTVRRDRIEEILAYLEETNPQEHEVLMDALFSTAEYTGGDVARALTSSGYEANSQQVNNYRRKKGFTK